MPYVTWLRRGTGRLMAPVLLGFLVVSLVNQPAWRVEADWATRRTAAPVLVVCPVVAAVAAFDTSRRLRPTLAALSRGSVRRRTAIALPALAVITWACAAYAVTWVVAVIVVGLSDGVGVTDYWVFVEVVAPMVGAGAVGLAVGMLAGPRVAAPFAVLAVLGALVLAAAWGDGPFQAQTTYGTLTGLQRPESRASAAVGGSLVVALAAGMTALEAARLRGRRRAVLAACTALAVAAAVLPAAWPWKVQAFEVTAETYDCIDGTPSVCGPHSRLPLLQPVQASLAEAYTVLAGSAFVAPTAFRVTRLDDYAQLDGAAPLDFDPADVRDGSYGADAIARALVRPHQCAELFSAASAPPLLDAQDVVVPWLVDALTGRVSASPVPPEVVSAFSVIEDCRPMTWDLR